MIEFVLNGKRTAAKCAGGTPVLDWLRGKAGLKGTREGCREGDCGACTVILGRPGDRGTAYRAVCSCILPMASVHGCHLVTIEGISPDRGMTPFQQSFHEHGASQCGFCTPGMIMSLTAYLLQNGTPDVNGAMASLDGNICRCTGYGAVKRAVAGVISSLEHRACRNLEGLAEAGHIPDFFLSADAILQGIPPATHRGELPVAGGTDLFVGSPVDVVGVEPRFINAPSGLEISGNRLITGAGTTVEELAGSSFFRERFPNLQDFFKRISSTQIRARATVGGNIMNGSPIADLAVLLLALEADVTTKKRTVPLNRLYTGYKTFLIEKGEVLQGISFEIPPEGAVLKALKVSKRPGLDIASVNSAALLSMDGNTVKHASMAAGGVYPFPLHLKRTSSFLAGKELTENTIRSAVNTALKEIAPISDIRGSKEYKRELLSRQIGVLLNREDN